MGRARNAATAVTVSGFDTVMGQRRGGGSNRADLTSVRPNAIDLQYVEDLLQQARDGDSKPLLQALNTHHELVDRRELLQKLLEGYCQQLLQAGVPEEYPQQVLAAADLEKIIPQPYPTVPPPQQQDVVRLGVHLHVLLTNSQGQVQPENVQSIVDRLQYNRFCEQLAHTIAADGDVNMDAMMSALGIDAFNRLGRLAQPASHQPLWRGAQLKGYAASFLDETTWANALAGAYRGETASFISRPPVKFAALSTAALRSSLLDVLEDEAEQFTQEADSAAQSGH